VSGDVTPAVLAAPKPDAKWLSKPAVLWAMDEAPGVPARLVSTLFAYARYADQEGRGSYPLAATVAAQTRKSVSQAKRDPLTDHLGVFSQLAGRVVMGVATVAGHDRRRGWAAGSGPAGGAALRVA
jgi:hypothetical protein